MADEAIADNPVVITVCASLRRNVDVPWLQTVLFPRILHHPRFRSVVVCDADGKRRFETVPDFTPTSASLNEYHVAVEHVGHEEKSHDLREKIFGERLSEIMSTPLDSDRPLWKIFLFPKWSIVTDGCPQEDCCMIIMRVHHSISDGIGLVKYFSAEVVDKAPEQDQTHLLVVPERQKQKLIQSRHVPGRGSAAGSSSKTVPANFVNTSKTTQINIPPPGLLQRAWECVEDVYLSSVRMLFPEPTSVLTKSTIQRDKVCALLPPSEFTLQMVKDASRVLGVTMNDLLYTAVAGATRAYLKEYGDNPDELKSLRCAIPFNEHMLDAFSLNDISNIFAIIALNLHVHEEDRMKRLEACVRTLRRAKRSYQLPMLMGLIQAVTRLPRAPRKAFWRHLTRAASILFTNVPGPKETVQLGGVDISSMHFFAPADGHAGVVVGLFSYVGKIAISVSGDKGRISNPLRFVELLKHEIEALIDVSKSV